MKKIMKLILALILSVSLVACGGGGSDEGGAGSSEGGEGAYNVAYLVM